MGANKTKSLCKIEGVLRKEGYLNILSDHAVPSGRRLIGPGFAFMLDKDPKHTVKMCKNYLQQLESQKQLKIMCWPPQSPDLNPLEKLWNELDRKIREVGPKSENELWDRLQAAWEQISPEIIEKLIKRMPKLAKEVIRKRGGYVDEKNI